MATTVEPVYIKKLYSVQPVIGRIPVDH